LFREAPGILKLASGSAVSVVQVCDPLQTRFQIISV
jgi:hypothetical protein